MLEPRYIVPVPVAVAALAVRAQVHVANVALVGAGACLVALAASLVTSRNRSVTDLDRHCKLTLQVSVLLRLTAAYCSVILSAIAIDVSTCAIVWI